MVTEAGELAEVRYELEHLRKRMKRVLLVLPPLSREEAQGPTIKGLEFHPLV